MDDAQGRAVDAAIDKLLLGGVFPAWLLAGVLDWYWHKQSDIEHTAGAPESIMHLLMGMQAGATFTIATFFRPNTLTVSAAMAAAILHHVTTLCDVFYAMPQRKLPEAERHTHSFLEVLPYVIAGLLAVRPKAASRAIPLRESLPSRAALTAVFASAGVVGFGPHIQELIRCVRARRT